MATINVLVLIHGMTLSADPGDHAAEYNSLWQRLQQRRPDLRNAIDTLIPIEWGHEPPTPTAEATPDQRITRAENVILERSGYDRVRADRSPDNVLLSSFQESFSKLVTRHVTTPIKETVMMLGMTDVLYYCSPDGERAIRRSVYTQLLNGLQPYRNEDRVQLHVVGHSLGATVAFDFLFGLFAPDSAYGGHEPGFVEERQGSPAVVDAYIFWRERAQRQTLLLGSKSSTGCQLPLMMMRKQKLVDMLAARQPFDPTVIGVPRDGPLRWLLFYDVDDVLGFPTRRIFDAEGSIREYQVDTDWRPNFAHSEYWEHSTVVEQIAALIGRNL